MKWFYDLRIAVKLRLAFATVLALTCVLGAMSFLQIREVNKSTTDLAVNWMPSVQAAQEMKAAMARYRVQELQKINNAQDGADITRYEKMMSDIQAGFKKAQRDYEALIADPNERVLYDEFKRLNDAYWVENGKMNVLLRDGKVAEARELMRGDWSKITANMNKAVEKVVEYNIEGGKKSHEAAQVNYNHALLTIASLLVVCVLIGMGLAWFIGRAIVLPLKEAVDVASTVAQGRLTSKIEAKSKDETGQLLTALSHMNESLTKIVGEVRGGTESISTASGEIASGNHDLSARTEEQASALEQTASSMEELTSTVKQNAENARQANQIAVSASEVAARGGELVSEVVTTMASISQSAGKIADIISVIDGIAFQTNILALNAAVEAARAGAEGRGFAVVASEVRALAQRSAGAAKEIKHLINDSLDKVASGSKLVDRTGSTMQEILSRVRNVTDIMGEISAASQEQTDGIEQINQSIAQMDQVTQQNAALVEEAAAASESMREQAARLAQAVSIFQLRQDAAVPATALVVKAQASALPMPQIARPAQLQQRQAVQPATKPQRQAVPALTEDWTEF